MSADLIPTLSQIALFKPLDPGQLAEFAKLLAIQEFTANQPVLAEGHPPPGFYILLEGKVAVMKHKPEGGADLICDLGPGECLGEVEILDNAKCTASVVCYGDVKAAVIVKENLEKFFEAFPTAAIKMLRQVVITLAERLRNANISYTSLMTIAESTGS